VRAILPSFQIYSNHPLSFLSISKLNGGIENVYTRYNAAQVILAVLQPVATVGCRDGLALFFLQALMGRYGM